MSRHAIHRRVFLPLNKLDKRLEGVTVFNPWSPARFDLVHAFNRIPLGGAPYVIGFESHLPRAYGLEGSSYYAALMRSLASVRCRAIVAISAHARDIFRDLASGRPESGALEAKLQIRYPNLIAPDKPAPLEIGANGEVRVLFVGAHLARKGGLVGLRMAERALREGFPLRVDIVSAMQMGAGIWTDPLRPDFYASYRRLLELPNVTVHGVLSNPEVMALIDRSHFSLLTTFGDTFGYSALESMSRGSPVIATAQGALREFIVDGVNGVLLPLETNAHGEWVHSSAKNRDGAAFEAIFAGEVERLAGEALAAVQALAADPAAYRAMRAAAHATIVERFDAASGAAFWDDLYVAAVQSAPARQRPFTPAPRRRASRANA